MFIQVYFIFSWRDETGHLTDNKSKTYLPSRIRSILCLHLIDFIESPWMKIYPLLFSFIFIFSHVIMTEYFSPERAMSVRVYVCMCVCVCLSQPFIWRLFGRFCCNLNHMILTRFWDDTFLRFWKCWSDDVIAAILYVFKWGTFAVAISLQSSSNL